jgi:GNAT superfamily N-acetyltransferase
MNIFKRLTAVEKQADDFGFMWSNTGQIFEQIQSECEEIKDNLSQLGDRHHLQEEMGDLIHAVFSLCLFMKFDAEETCVKSIEKFEKRFAELKRLAHAAGFETLKGQPVDVLMHLWTQAKEKVLLNSHSNAPSWEYRFLTQSDIPFIVSAFTTIGWNKPASLYQKYLKEQENDQRCVWVAFKDNDFAGYVTLKWYSDYLPFREQNIPEISDLNVLPKFRKQGIASELLSLVETKGGAKSATVGIGVGLSSDYGDAQKLYVKRGYVPDGRGITHNYQPVKFDDSVRLDDALVLWFRKCLYKE